MATQPQNLVAPRRIIDDFVSSLPQYIRCTSDFDTGLRKPTLKNTALKDDYIQFNESNCVAWIVFDIDRGWQSANAWHDASVAEPNLIVQNPKSGNCHYFYKLKAPVYLKTADNAKVRAAPEDYLNAIKEAMTSALNADDCYTHLICKNPLSAKWRALECHTTPFELFDLAKHLTLKSKFDTFLKKRKKLIERRFAQNDRHYVQGRNCSLFDDLRLYAYSIVKSYKAGCGKFDSFHAKLFEYANDLNKQFSLPLPVSEIKSTVKSVSRWTWNKFTGSCESCNRGVMGFGQTRRDNPELAALSPEEIKNRQKAAAIRTHEIKRSTTEQKIKAAINALIQAKEALNNTAIAKKAGLARNTIIAFSRIFGGCSSWWYQVVASLKDSVKGVSSVYINLLNIVLCIGNFIKDRITPMDLSHWGVTFFVSRNISVSFANKCSHLLFIYVILSEYSPTYILYFHERLWR